LHKGARSAKRWGGKVKKNGEIRGKSSYPPTTDEYDS